MAGAMTLGSGQFLLQQRQRGVTSSCGRKSVGRPWLSGAPAMCADDEVGGCQSKLVLAGIGVGLTAILAAALLPRLSRSSEENGSEQHPDEDETAQKAAKVLAALQLNATKKGETELSRLRQERFEALVEASGSTGAGGILAQSLEDGALRQALLDLCPEAVDVPVSRAEFMAGAAVAAVLADRRRGSRDINEIVFDLFSAVDSDCDAQLTASEVLALSSAMRSFGLLDDTAKADASSMNITEFSSFYRSRLRLQ